MVRHLLAASALDAFNEHFGPETVTETIPNVLSALKKVAAKIFPDNSVADQRQFLMHELKKPNKLTARETSTRLELINNWSKYFPSGGNDRTLDVNELQASELKEIYYRLLPAAWRRKMEENVQFDRSTKILRDIVDYAERLETLESRFDTKPNFKQKDSQGGSKNPKGHAKKGDSESGGANNSGKNSTYAGSKDCLVHGDGCGHPTHKCKIVIDHSIKVKGQYKASYKGADKKPFKKGSDSKWKPGDSKNYSKKEVQLLLKRQGKRNEVLQQNAKELNMLQEGPIDDDLDLESLMDDPICSDDQLDNELDGMLIE
jgi:hypothetical protein